MEISYMLKYCAIQYITTNHMCLDFNFKENLKFNSLVSPATFKYSTATCGCHIEQYRCGTFPSFFWSALLEMHYEP